VERQKDKRDERMVIAKSRMLTVGGKTAEDHFLEHFFAEWSRCSNHFDSRTIEVHLDKRVNRNRARDRSKSVFFCL